VAFLKLAKGGVSTIAWIDVENDMGSIDDDPDVRFRPVLPPCSDLLGVCCRILVAMPRQGMLASGAMDEGAILIEDNLAATAEPRSDVMER
jgi:hypothetical protein